MSVMQNDPLITAVLPTGGGKSLLFMLPASIESETTAVVVPYKSLAEDLLNRCLEAGVGAVIWKADDHPPACSIVIAVADSAVASVNVSVNAKQTFMQYLSVLKVNGLLKRIVIDECHTVLTESSFRIGVDNLFHLRSLSVPMLFLTATLPPSSIEEFKDSLALKGSEVRYIRAQAFRRNIKIEVKQCSNGRVFTATLQLAMEAKASLPAGEKIVVYCRQKQHATYLSSKNMLNCPSYTSELNEEQRRDVLAAWLENGEQPFLTATTAFGCGVDVPGIVQTIHVNMPYTLINFLQECGRGGRHSKRSLSTIIVEDRNFSDSKRGSGKGFLNQDQRLLELMLTTTSCRVKVITRFLNGGEGMVCADLACELCDNCQRESPTLLPELEPPIVVNDGGQAVRTKVAERSFGIQTIVDTLDWLTSGCTACKLVKGEEHAQHLLSQCSRIDRLSFVDITNFSRKIKWPANFGICWRCGLPEELCTEVKKPFAQRGTCKWSWVLVTVAMFAQRGGSLAAKTKALAGEEEFAEQRYVKWLAKDTGKRIHGIRSTNAFAVLDMYAKTARCIGYQPK